MANVNARRVEEILTSGITAGHYVAGSNITITENQDGTETIASTGGGGGGTTDYSDLTNKPSINNVTLSGDKTTSDLGIDEVPDVTSSDDGKILKASYSDSTGTYGWGNLTSTDVTSVLSGAQQFALNSGITSTKVSNYDAISGKMETFYPNLLDVGENAGEITAQDLDNLSFGIYEYLGMFTGSTLPTELAYKTGVVRGYFTQGGGATTWNVQFQMVETTDGIFGARVYQGNNTWSNWTFNVPGGGGTAPTTYTAPTAGTDVTNVVGGYVVSNNICTVNIGFKRSFSSPGTGTVLFSGLPKPALKPDSTDATISNVFVIGSTVNATTGKAGAYVYLTQGGSIITADISYGSLGTGSKIITGSYLVDTSS